MKIRPLCCCGGTRVRACCVPVSCRGRASHERLGMLGCGPEPPSVRARVHRLGCGLEPRSLHMSVLSCLRVRRHGCRGKW